MFKEPQFNSFNSESITFHMKKSQNLSRLTHEEMENMNELITTN